MHRKRPQQPDPDRYIPTPVERVAQELAVLGGTASILQGTLDRVKMGWTGWGTSTMTPPVGVARRSGIWPEV